MSHDIFLKLKKNAEKDILGRDFKIAQSLLSSRYMEIAIHEPNKVYEPCKHLRVQVIVDDFNKVVEIVGWF